ncbi:MAG: phosphatidate cytidylyltransferase [Bacteroidales bacterium]|nr:phosphatidate cytidylyltransferase [Bacteroidales bacterium]
MKKLLIRTLSGAVYVMIVIGSIYCGRLLDGLCEHPYGIGLAVFTTVFFLIGIIGVHEVTRNLKIKGFVCNEPAAFIIATITYAMLVTYNFDPQLGLRFRYMLPALLACAALAQLWRKDEHPFATIGYSILPTLWVMVPMAMMAILQQMGLMIMVFILIWVNDSFAYMTGMLFGRHKMWERHSPNKTWEGTIGGALFCIATAEIFGPMFNIIGMQIGWIDWLFIGLICSTLGTLGDMVESMFKRSCGVKDSGNIMPGHGGVLDRFDSLLMAVPFIVAYLLLAN